MSEKIVPVHAQGFFTMGVDGRVTQVTIFDYYDPECYYAKLLQGKGDLEGELWRLAANMQSFLDEEKVLINGERVKPEVRGIDICVRGDPKRPSVVFFITFKGELRPGVNSYEDCYEATVAEYDYEFYWIFPPGTSIVSVKMPGTYEVVNAILMVWVRKGEKVDGYERIIFKIPHQLR